MHSTMARIPLIVVVARVRKALKLPIVKSQQ